MSAEGRARALGALSRRGLLALAGAGLGLAATGLSMPPAWARGRSPVGGRLVVPVPWPVTTVDPHRIDDAVAAFVGEGLFDTLYGRDEGGLYVPHLAEGDPEPTPGGGLRITLRSGLKTGAGRSLEARDVAASLARARALGARAILAPIPVPKVEGRALVFASKDAAKLTRALASPLTAVVPPAFTPDRPDGTGPFRAERRDGGLSLTRNPLAARGPAYLDEIVLRAAPDVAACLRAFESGAADLGWLGAGLHEPRTGSRPFDGGAVGWVVLRTGHAAGSWDAPGVAQRLADGLSPSRLSYLGLGPAWRPSTDGGPSDQGWGGSSGDLAVRDDCPWLLEVAKAVAASLSRPGHEITVRSLGPVDFGRMRSARAFSLAVDVVRAVGPSALDALVALATGEDGASAEDVAKHPPRIAEGTSPRTLTRTLRLAVVGEVRMQGARLADTTLPGSPSGFGLDLGGATRIRRG